MEKPVSMSADDIRDEKVKVLRCLKAITKEDTVLGQHTAANGIPGYLEDEGVPKHSKTPTFATMILRIENDRFAPSLPTNLTPHLCFLPGTCATESHSCTPVPAVSIAS